MSRKLLPLMLLVLLIGTLNLVSRVEKAKAVGGIHIRADGSIDPPAAPIQRVGDTFTFTDNIHDSIVVERDNIIVDGNGYLLQGSGAFKVAGIDLPGRTNVTIWNTQIKNFYYGISLYQSSYNNVSRNNITTNSLNGIILDPSSSHNIIGGNNISDSGYGIELYAYSNYNTISGNNIANNYEGIRLSGYSTNNLIDGNSVINNGGSGIWLNVDSGNNSISGNNITANSPWGIELYSSYNNIGGNNIAENWYGILLFGSSSNLIEGNTIKNGVGIWLNSSSKNTIYYNNFDNSQQVSVDPSYYANVWEDSFSSHGNYWSDYTERYPEAEELDGSGIWNTPYFIDAYNQDSYPLVYPHTPPPEIVILSPENKTYTVVDVPLTLTTNEATSWIGYSLDNTANETILGNTILLLSEGKHSIVVYANDTSGNMGVSNKVYFTLDITAPFTSNNYDNMWHNTNFIITLAAIDNASGVKETSYRINNGPVKDVNLDGQPLITTESANNTLEYWSTDNAGNDEIHQYVTGVKLDKTAPEGSIVINNGSLYTSSTSLMLYLTAADTLSGVHEVRYSSDGVWDTEPWASFSQTKSWTLPPGDGNRTVYYQIKDNAGLISPVCEDTIILDTSAPTGSILINEGTPYTNSSEVTLQLSANDSGSGVDSMRFSNDSITWSNWEAYSSIKNWTLTSGDEIKTVYFQIKDNANLISITYAATVILDTSSPNITQVYQTPTANVEPDNQVNVDVAILDANGVNTAILNYTTGNGAWITVDMIFTGRSMWNASIPAFPKGTNITYTIMAEDVAGNQITTEELGNAYEYQVVPEFPSFPILLSFMILALLTVIFCRKKQLSASCSQ